MITGNTLSELHVSVWAAAYVLKQTEFFELRTMPPLAQAEDGLSVLWHRECPVGTAIADFLEVDLNELDQQWSELRDWLKNMDEKREAESRYSELFALAQSWLEKSCLFAPLAAALERLCLVHLEEMKRIVDDMDGQIKYFRELQPRLKELAEDFFVTDTQQDMRSRYFYRQASRGFGTYPSLTVGKIRLYSMIQTPDGILSQDTVPVEAALSPMVDSADGKKEILATEVLDTRSSQEYVDFILYRYLCKNLRFRVCKYCGRYFGVIGNPKSEYCDRLIEGSTKTCKETGSYRIYTKRKMEEPAVREYKRSYKAHNARIRYGLMTREQFQTWSQEAREKRDQCASGQLSLDDFIAWLDSDRM